MALFRVSHPPAGATTLIVSLGIISQPRELVIIEIAVILLTAQALAINRLAGIPYPLWRNRESPNNTAADTCRPNESISIEAATENTQPTGRT
jgi:CBS-domain-containing membrane protein